MTNELMAVSVILGAILATLIALNYILAIIGSYKLFLKAGEKGWKAIIPILNEYTRFKLYANNNLFLSFLTHVGYILQGASPQRLRISSTIILDK